MPYFAWKGVNLKAQDCKGSYFARNKQELDDYLFKKDIALLSCKTKKIIFNRTISSQSKIDYFLQIKMLIQAGMHVPQALRLVAQQSNVPYLTMKAHSIADHVEGGNSISQALLQHKKVFAPLISHLMSVGQESGNLSACLDVLTMHLESMESFKSRLRTALLLPAVTFAFFMCVIIIMLMVIVPQLATVFNSMHRELPAATQTMINISNVFRSGQIFLVLGICAIPLSLLLLYCKTENGKVKVDKMLLKIPIVKQVIINKAMAHFFQSLQLLLRGGLPLLTAVKIVKASLSNYEIKEMIYSIEQEINAGSSLAHALSSFESLCSPDIISLLLIGQESGNLVIILERISHIYQNKLLKTLARINTLFQPFLLIILGLMITGLIVAMYSPVMSASYLMY